jgi:hypothetical protein
LEIGNFKSGKGRNQYFEQEFEIFDDTKSKYVTEKMNKIG